MTRSTSSGFPVHPPAIPAGYRVKGALAVDAAEAVRGIPHVQLIEPLPETCRPERRFSS